MAHQDIRKDTDVFGAAALQTNAVPALSAGVLTATSVELSDTESPVDEKALAKLSEVILSTDERHGSLSVDESETVLKQTTWQTWTQQENAGQPSGRYPRPWNTTILRAGPISGIFSMFLAIASIFACFGILEGSNGAEVGSWSVQPSLYLAIFTAIANLAMRYACIQGIVIAWWTRALRGSTLSKLHWDWRSGTTLIGTLTGGRQMGWFGLACIFSTLVTVDGPLLARPMLYVPQKLENSCHSTLPGSLSTFGDIVQFMYGRWESYAAFYNTPEGIRRVLLKDWVAEAYTAEQANNCASYSDPYEDVMGDLNTVMVYLSIQAARENASYLETHMDPGWPIHTTTVGVVVGDHNVCKSEFRFVIAAAVIELACILLVAPTYWGVRAPLGKSVTRTCGVVASWSTMFVFTAGSCQAFESPLLTDVNSNSSGRDLARTVGEVRVQYGATRRYGMLEKSKLAFANPILVTQPEKGARFDL